VGNFSFSPNFALRIAIVSKQSKIREIYMQLTLGAAMLHPNLVQIGPIRPHAVDHWELFEISAGKFVELSVTQPSIGRL